MRQTCCGSVLRITGTGIREVHEQCASRRMISGVVCESGEADGIAGIARPESCVRSQMLACKIERFTGATCFEQAMKKWLRNMIR